MQKSMEIKERTCIICGKNFVRAINIQIKHLPLTEPVYCRYDLYCFVPHSDSLGRIECNQRQLITFESLRSGQQTIEFSISCLLSRNVIADLDQLNGLPPI